MPVIKKTPELPADIHKKLRQLDQELEEEELTVKGYCKRKWAILRDYASKNISIDIENILTSITQKLVDEKQAYTKMFDILQKENISKNFSEESENLISENDILEYSYIKSAESSLENPILNNISQKLPSKICNKSVQNRVSKLKNKRKFASNDERKTKQMRLEAKNKSSIVKRTFRKPILLSNNCEICGQNLDDPKTVSYKGHPLNAVNELKALADSKLLPFNEEQNKLQSADDVPHHKVTQFTVYDKNGHLCSFDTGLIEKNIALYFSGYLKPIYDVNPQMRNGIPIRDAGPIENWFTCGFHKGHDPLLAFTTPSGFYYLLEPSKEYKLFMSKPITNSLKSTIVNNFFNKVIINKISIQNIFKKTELAEKLKNGGNLLPNKINSSDKTNDNSKREIDNSHSNNRSKTENSSISKIVSSKIENKNKLTNKRNSTEKTTQKNKRFKIDKLSKTRILVETVNNEANILPKKRKLREELSKNNKKIKRKRCKRDDKVNKQNLHEKSLDISEIRRHTRSQTNINSFENISESNKKTEDIREEIKDERLEINDKSSKSSLVIETFNRVNKSSQKIVNNKKTTHNSNKTIDELSETNEESLPTKIELSFNIRVENIENCDICGQDLNDPNLLIYQGHPKNAVDELKVLKELKLISNDTEDNKINFYRITQFTVYDKNGHLCPFDSGLVEKNIPLYLSGFVKTIFEEDQTSKNEISVEDIGPIVKWSTSGFNREESAVLSFSTARATYVLMEPSVEYKPIMISALEKIYLSEIVIEFLLKTAWQNPTYEDLLIFLKIYDLPPNFGPITEDMLLRHAKFICKEVSNFELAAKDNIFVETACINSLMKFANATFSERKKIREKKMKIIRNKTKSRRKNFTKATTTKLVREVFDSFFPAQLDKNKRQEKSRCGNCKNCRKSGCGNCKNCKKNSGKTGKKKLNCIRHQCTNLDSDSDSEESSNSTYSANICPTNISKNIIHRVTWLSDPITIENNRKIYSEAKVGSEIIKPGDHIILKDETGLKFFVAKIIYLWEENKQKYFHANLFRRGVHTVLGEISDKREIFQTDDCENCPLGAIFKKIKVEYEILLPSNNVSSEIFFCQKRYDQKRGRFENLYNDNFNDDICKIVLGYKPCGACKRQDEKEKSEIPVFQEGIIKWRNEEFKIGTGVYLIPGTYDFRSTPVPNSKKKEMQSVDEDIYPEFYRKKAENIIGIEISEPFCIGYITEILQESEKDLKISVQKLYRPENIQNGAVLSQEMDINIVYWSEEQITLPFSKVTGKCFIAFGGVLDISVQDWSLRGPNRFYFLESYDSNTHKTLSVGESGLLVGQNFVNCEEMINFDVPETYGFRKEPLKTMDLFAGCGGLSLGLHQSGVADTKWAIEKEEAAALAYKQNNPQTIVYSEDCNNLLTQIISGASKTKKHQPLPQREEVELLVGGPPCQGFSGMNRFNAGQYSLFKNSLIVSYLSYCDFYRPRFFILENVRNFVTFKKSMVLKLTLRCLLAMGYQCAFGVLQAGNYGVPQIRRRSIILAAAPGEILPDYPEPLHVFTSKRANPLDIVIDNCRYNTGSKWLDIGAPYRTITVRDAISDLPEIKNGCSLQEQSYGSGPLSHFQRQIRGPGEPRPLRDHICKEMAPIVEARMSYIPTNNGGDWRDLPNIEIALSDGTRTNKLKYEWHDKRNGKNSKGSFRGVCSCASKKKCTSSTRQYNTLIPWCLPHTANRHNNWVGLYGRLEWDGVFNTTVTNPEPMAKQGRVLHSTQNRVVSVRECARSQGFPDRYRFYGNIVDKHRQVGNAVPPPLGKAIGQEILKAVASNKI